MGDSTKKETKSSWRKLLKGASPLCVSLMERRATMDAREGAIGATVERDRERERGVYRERENEKTNARFFPFFPLPSPLRGEERE